MINNAVMTDSIQSIKKVISNRKVYPVFISLNTHNIYIYSFVSSTDMITGSHTIILNLRLDQKLHYLWNYGHTTFTLKNNNSTRFSSFRKPHHNLCYGKCIFNYKIYFAEVKINKKNCLFSDSNQSLICT